MDGGVEKNLATGVRQVATNKPKCQLAVATTGRHVGDMTATDTRTIIAKTEASGRKMTATAPDRAAPGGQGARGQGAWHGETKRETKIR